MWIILLLWQKCWEKYKTCSHNAFNKSLAAFWDSMWQANKKVKVVTFSLLYLDKWDTFEKMVWEVLLSMCCFYWLMNKLPWPVNRQNLGRRGKPNWMLGEWRQSQRKAPARDRHWTLPMSHSHMAIYRLMQMG